MGIRQRSAFGIEFDDGLESRAPHKITLVRANPYTCSCAEEGRTSPAIACVTCNGTGYTGGQRGANLATAGAPYNTLYYIYGDVQEGRGRYGAPDDLMYIDSDLGKLEVGDAMLFCKMQDFDRASGQSVSPTVDSNFVRPDHVISVDGTAYTVVKSLRGNVGQEDSFRMFIVRQGDQGVKS